MVETTQSDGGNGRLVIFVNSDRHPDYVMHLARAACAKGKTVSVHFFGCGVLLAVPHRLQALAKVAQVSVCADSFEQFSLDTPIDPSLCVPASRTAELIGSCGRRVVF